MPKHIDFKKREKDLVMSECFGGHSHTVRLTSVDNPVHGNREFCFAHLQTTIVGQVKKIRSPTWGIV